MAKGIRVNPHAVRQLRELQGYGLNAFAESAGLSGAALSRIETGEREPRTATLKKIADSLGCELTDIAIPVDDGNSEPKSMTSRSAEVAANVRLMRQIKKVSAQKLADEITHLGFPVSRSSVANYESGRKYTLPVDYVLLAAEVLDTDPMQLLLGPVHCPTCKGEPPEGFTCNTCGGDR